MKEGSSCITSQGQSWGPASSVSGRRPQCFHSLPGGPSALAQPPPDRNFRLQWKRRARGTAGGAGCTLQQPPRQVVCGPCGPPLRRSSRTCPADQDLAQEVNVSATHQQEQGGHVSHQRLWAHMDLCSPPPPPPLPEHRSQRPRGLPGEGTGPGPATPCWGAHGEEQEGRRYRRLIP